MTEPTTTTPAAGGDAAAARSALGWPADVEARLRSDAATVIARYPDSRSALGPLLHLVQSVDSFVSPRGVALCAELLGLSRAEVSAVATFYTQYKRKPNGRYTVGVCTNTLCAVMGGDGIYEAVSSHLGIGNEETTPDGAITLERVECNAACDYAPVVMVNWEFFDNQTPASATRLVDSLVAGEEVTSTRGPVVQDFRHVSRVLAGFEDGLVDEGEAGAATLVGLELARSKGWAAPAYPGEASGSTTTGDVPPAAAAASPSAGSPPSGEEGTSAQHATPVGEAEKSGEQVVRRAGAADATATESADGDGAKGEDEPGGDSGSAAGKGTQA